MFRNDLAENADYKVERIRQDEVNDIFKVTYKILGSSDYERYPRSLEMNADEIMEDLFLEEEDLHGEVDCSEYPLLF